MNNPIQGIGLEYIGSDKNFGQFYLGVCPVCNGQYVHITNVVKLSGNDNYEAESGLRGDVVRLEFFGECGSIFHVNYGFHKGNTLAWARVIQSCKVDYQAYIQSGEWKTRADAAKKAAGWRCQVCNKPSSELTLDAHHRTYERLGHERPDDITVLCRDCHELYEANKKARRNGGNR